VWGQTEFPLKKQWTLVFGAAFSLSLRPRRVSHNSFLRLRFVGVLGYESGAFSVSATQGIAGKYANSLRMAWIGFISASWHIRPKFLLTAPWESQKTVDRGLASAAADFCFLVGPVEIRE